MVRVLLGYHQWRGRPVYLGDREDARGIWSVCRMKTAAAFQQVDTKVQALLYGSLLMSFMSKTRIGTRSSTRDRRRSVLIPWALKIILRRWRGVTDTPQLLRWLESREQVKILLPELKRNAASSPKFDIRQKRSVPSLTFIIVSGAVRWIRTSRRTQSPNWSHSSSGESSYSAVASYSSRKRGL